MRFSGQYPPEFLNLPAVFSCPVLLKAKEREIEEKIFWRWCIGYQSEMSLSEFKNKLKPAPVKSAKAIMTDVYGYIDLFSKGFKEVELGDI